MKYLFIPNQDVFCADKVNQILNAALKSVNPRECVRKNIKLSEDSIYISANEISLSEFQDILLIGAGKGVLSMAMGTVDQLGERIKKGLLISKHPDNAILQELPRTIKVSQGDHPVPSQRSVQASRQMISLIETASENELVICLISGGGSALMTLPVEGIELEQIQELTELLLRSGANIEEMNIIRKHIDQVKGGGLLKSIFPARSVSLILSDVLGDHIPSIASGPTAADQSTYQDAIEIIYKYDLQDRVRPGILNHLAAGESGKIGETLKNGDPILANHQNVLVGSLQIAAEAAVAKAKELGFNSDLMQLDFTGEARDVGKRLGVLLKSAVVQNSLPKPVCLVAGGEPTVTIKGSGKGGRNQEVALSVAQELKDVERCLFISLASDGEDGPTDAAGGFVSGETFNIGMEKGLNAQEYIDSNDSYHYLEQTGSLIQIGPTGTNVNDLYLMIAY